MRENEFEKKVQQKMGDFNIHPSEEVWVEVERRIREEKKRRFIFWWPLLFLLVGGGITAGILLGKNKEKSENVTARNNTENTIRSSSEKTGTPKPAGNLTNADDSNIAGHQTADPLAEPRGQDSVSRQTTNNTVLIKEKSSEIKTPPGKAGNSFLRGNKPAGKETTEVKRQEANKEAITKNNIVITDKEKKDQHNQPLVTVPVPSEKTGGLKETVKVNDIVSPEKKELSKKNDQPEPVQPSTDSITKDPKTKIADKRSKKWDWGIHISGGRSMLVNGLHFFDNSLYGDQLSVSPTTASRSSSDIRPSASFGAGFYVKQPVSKKLDINIGLGYSYLSTRMYVGNRVDSTRTITNGYSPGLSVTNFYRPAGNTSYTNRYHFLSLSADASWRIINGDKLKLYWDNGISYSRLLGSSMLHYDRNLPGYYKDNNRLIKDQVFFSTGLSVPVGKRMTINPFASYSILPVLNNTDTLQSHYSNFGLRIRLLLNKK